MLTVHRRKLLCGALTMCLPDICSAGMPSRTTCSIALVQIDGILGIFQ
jgi:hypothetical protein